jgi:mannose-6-phosphate isomerase-like protein (cupin superfamily)
LIAETLLTDRLTENPMGSLLKTTVLENEVKDVQIEFISIKGMCQTVEQARSDCSDVLLIIHGEGELLVNNENYNINSSTIIRIPYSERYELQVDEAKELDVIRIRKLLNSKDIQLINSKIENYNTLYFKTLAECPTYKEDIKSEKTINRMILPEGLVPRFAMGSVETDGPDEVGEHEHPMLDQIFFGLEGCRCSCFAGGDKVVLTENMLLHIPLGSLHYVSVEAGDKLSYIWLDFFLTHEGEKYMGEQHQMEEK